MLWPRRVWWVAGELPVSVAGARCAGCSRELTSGEDATPPAGDAPGMKTLAASDADDARVGEDTPVDAASDAADGDAGLTTPGPIASSTDAPTFAYCSTCRRARERQRETTRLAMALALASAVVSALGLPLLRLDTGLEDTGLDTGLAGHLLATLLAAALPLAVLARPWSRQGGSGAPRVWPIGRAGLVVEGAALAERLGGAGIRCRAVWLPPLVYRPGLALVAGVALAFGGLGYAWHHPRVWVLALGAAPLTVSVDGAVVARLDPVQPGAAPALSLRLPSGARHLSARDDAGRSVADVMATLSPGREHLFAPGGADECFWLERTGYGRDTTREAIPLLPAARFFTLDAGVDGWLSGSPPPSASDRRSTGGILVLLRHAPCPRAPEPVRAASAAGP